MFVFFECVQRVLMAGWQWLPPISLSSLPFPCTNTASLSLSRLSQGVFKVLMTDSDLLSCFESVTPRPTLSLHALLYLLAGHVQGADDGLGTAQLL